MPDPPPLHEVRWVWAQLQGQAGLGQSATPDGGHEHPHEGDRRVLARLERDASGGLRITVRLLGEAGVPVASAAAPLPEDLEPLLARAASLVPGLFEARGAGGR